MWFRILRSQKHQLLWLYRVSPRWRQEFNRHSQMYISSQVKSALRKCSEDKDHDCDSFMSDVSVLYQSCVSHLAKWTTLFAEFKCFHKIPPFANNWMGKWWTMWVVSAYRNVSIDEAEVNCLTNTETCSSSSKKSINQVQFTVKWWNMINRQNILQLAIPLALSSKHTIDELSDAITGGKDIGLWSSNIPEKMREYWLKNEKLFFKHDVQQHRKDRNSLLKCTTNLMRRQNHNAEVVESSWLCFSLSQTCVYCFTIGWGAWIRLNVRISLCSRHFMVCTCMTYNSHLLRINNAK